MEFNEFITNLRLCSAEKYYLDSLAGVDDIDPEESLEESIVRLEDEKEDFDNQE